MSKVFEENAQKAISLSEGLKKHYSEVSRYGVVESELDLLNCYITLNMTLCGIKQISRWLESINIL